MVLSLSPLAFLNVESTWSELVGSAISSSSIQWRRRVMGMSELSKACCAFFSSLSIFMRTLLVTDLKFKKIPLIRELHGSVIISIAMWQFEWLKYKLYLVILPPEGVANFLAYFAYLA